MFKQIINRVVLLSVLPLSVFAGHKDGGDETSIQFIYSANQVLNELEKPENEKIAAKLDISKARELLHPKNLKVVESPINLLHYKGILDNLRQGHDCAYDPDTPGVLYITKQKNWNFRRYNNSNFIHKGKELKGLIAACLSLPQFPPEGLWPKGYFYGQRYDLELNTTTLRLMYYTSVVRDNFVFKMAPVVIDLLQDNKNLFSHINIDINRIAEAATMKNISVLPEERMEKDAEVLDGLLSLSLGVFWFGGRNDPYGNSKERQQISYFNIRDYSGWHFSRLVLIFHELLNLVKQNDGNSAYDDDRFQISSLLYEANFDNLAKKYNCGESRCENLP